MSFPQCHASKCVSNAPCGSLELSYEGRCWPWGSEEACGETGQVLISDIYGNVTCACQCLDRDDGTCVEDGFCDDVPRDVFTVIASPPRVKIPTVVYHQKHIQKILCLDDPLYCDFE